MAREHSHDFYQKYYPKYTLNKLSKIPNERLGITDRFAKVLHEICTNCNRHSALSDIAKINGYSIVEKLIIPDFGRHICSNYSIEIPNLIETSTDNPQQEGSIILIHRHSGRIVLQMPINTDKSYLTDKLQELENYFLRATTPRA